MLFGQYRLHLDLQSLQTLCLVVLIFSGQALLYSVRERRHFWSSHPSKGLMMSSVVDVLIISTLSTTGTLMKALPIGVVLGLLGATIVFGLLLDAIKVEIFRIFKII
jgi:H+-transporting ATPase